MKLPEERSTSQVPTGPRAEGGVWQYTYDVREVLFESMHDQRLA